MSRLKRVCLVLFAFVLLPLGPAHAEPKDEIFWRGTVTVRLVKRWTSLYSYSLNGQNYQSIVRANTFIERKISGTASGVMTEDIKYKYYYESPYVCGVYPNQNLDKVIITSDESFTYSPRQLTIYVTDNQASILGSFPNQQVIHHVDNPCGLSDEDQVYIASLAPWSLNPDEGDFSADSNEILGYSENSYNMVYGNGTHDTQTIVVIYDLTKQDLDTPWFSQNTKNLLEEVSFGLSVSSSLTFGASIAMCLTVAGCAAGAPLGIVSGIEGVGSLGADILAKDPPDPNYTEIAIPVSPTTSQQPIVAKGDLTQVQADAFEALIETDEQIIGLERAILSSFNRASGALQADDSYWVAQQLQTARIYSGQLADLLEARHQLLEDLKQALQTYPDIPLSLTAKDISQLHYDLVTNGLNAEQEQLLNELGVDQRGKARALHDLILAEIPQEIFIQDPVAQFPDLLTDPDLIQATQDLAKSLREFAEGAGLKIYLPIVTN